MLLYVGNNQHLYIWRLGTESESFSASYRDIIGIYRFLCCHLVEFMERCGNVYDGVNLYQTCLFYCV